MLLPYSASRLGKRKVIVIDDISSLSEMPQKKVKEMHAKQVDPCVETVGGWGSGSAYEVDGELRNYYHVHVKLRILYKYIFRILLVFSLCFHS